ncbi:V-type proton ATPase subunit D [Dictyocoela muelleri]|nr:V-type proton ATPase subunit D [Dictyocoela muelleri]
MSDKERIPVFPTRMNKTIITGRLKSAERGHKLLKQKSDALLMRYRTIQSHLNTEMHGLQEMLSEAQFLLSQAEYLGANIDLFLHESNKHPLEIETKTEIVSGIVLPTFQMRRSSNSSMKDPLFLEKSSQALVKCRNKYILILEKMLSIASLKNSFIILDEVLKRTNRRVNALEYFLIPRLQNSIDYINSELDEADGEDFFRLKKVQSHNKR